MRDSCLGVEQGEGLHFRVRVDFISVGVRNQHCHKLTYRVDGKLEREKKYKKKVDRKRAKEKFLRQRLGWIGRTGMAGIEEKELASVSRPTIPAIFGYFCCVYFYRVHPFGAVTNSEREGGCYFDGEAFWCLHVLVFARALISFSLRTMTHRLWDIECWGLFRVKGR